LEGDLDVPFGGSFGDQDDFVPGLEVEGASGDVGFAVADDGGDDRPGREEIWASVLPTATDISLMVVSIMRTPACRVAGGPRFQLSRSPPG